MNCVCSESAFLNLCLNVALLTVFLLKCLFECQEGAHHLSHQILGSVPQRSTAHVFVSAEVGV